jgi:predicted nucleotidyltransferase component of viral defense system
MMVIEQMLARYPRHTDAQETHALREVMQEIALAGLGRGGFFGKAAFYGGTCLRIFHGLRRFSEDLDFSLLKPDSTFSFAPYLQTLRDEFSAFGFEIQIEEKQKTAASDIVSAFLKKTSSRYDLHVSGRKTLKIKFEVDTDPPLGFATEEKLLIQPYSFYVKCFALPDLFAGKMHALLFRQWKNRVKGRDWYDFEWYVRKGVPLNLAHLSERSRQSGHWSGDDMDREQFMKILHQRIESVDFASARQDVEHFVSDAEELAIWSTEYFLQLAQMILVEP